jgi:hypothetical protein
MDAFHDGYPLQHAKDSVTQSAIDPAGAQAAAPAPRVLVVCPSCASTLSVKRAYVGSAIQCKQCAHIFTVPTATNGSPFPVVDQTSPDALSRPRQASPDCANLRAGVLDSVILDQLAQIITGTNEIRVSHDRLRNEHNELRADRDAISARLVAATEHLERLRAELGTLAPSDVRALVSERGELLTRVERLNDEKRDLMEQLEASTAELRTAGEDRQQMGEQLALLRDELASARADVARSGEECQEAKQRCKELHDQNEELVRAQAHRESEHDALLAAERAARQQLAEEVLALNANAEETARVTSQLLSASINHASNGTSSAASELDALRLQASELKSKLDEANDLYRVMAEMLDGFGRQIATLLPQDQSFDFIDEPASPARRLPHLGFNVDRTEPVVRR